MFTAVIAIVETAQARALQPLKDRKQTVEKEAKDLTDELQAEISMLEKSISEFDDISALEDHILFLQVRGNFSRLNPFHLMNSRFNRRLLPFWSLSLCLRVTHLFKTWTTPKTGER